MVSNTGFTGVSLGRQLSQGARQAVRRAHVGLKDLNCPSGSFLFLGPTGVGMTEGIRALAQELIGSAEMMTRIDII